MTDLARAHRLLNEALDVPADQRLPLIERECLDDPEMARFVVDLLAAHEQPMSLVDRPLVERLADRVREKNDGAESNGEALPWSGPEADARIGPYRIVREIGSGGMGLVFEAEQEEPVRRRVALKLIKPGMDSREVTRRFEMERQTLFSLEHPHIARAYDASVTDNGRPYFVMELVEGEPITTYCDQRSLDLDGRLRLFVLLCRAVQYAHLRGVIHRDLKPSNVLVVEQQSAAVPKVIDFGIAKALAVDGTSADGTQLTRRAQPLGTPETMSPEQARGETVDIRTDVYSAGVLLYRLLCGEYPFSSEELRSSDWTTAARLLDEKAAMPPSTRARKGGAGAPGVSLALLSGRRGRELDWIVLRALAKDPERRYQSMDELAADLDRYLRHEAVLAGPESWSYRTRKFVERHRAGVAVAGLFLLLILGSAFGLAVQASRLRAALSVADTERAEAEQVTDLLSEMISGADPYTEGRNDVTALELLDRGERNARESLVEQPEALARLLLLMGTSRLNLGDQEHARELVGESVELYRVLVDPGRLALALGASAEVHVRLSRLEVAEQMALEAVAVARSSSQEPVLVEALRGYAEVLREAGRFAEAEETLVEAIALAEGVEEPSAKVIRKARYNLALARLRLGRGEEALAELLGLLEVEEADPIGGLFLADLRNSIGAQLDELGRSSEALPYLRSALANQVEVLGRTHPRTLVTRSNVALVAGNLGDLELARDMNLESLEVLRERNPGPHGQNALFLNNLGLNQHGLGDLEAAKASFREALEIQTQVVGDDHPNLAFHLSNLARVLQEEGQWQAAEGHYRHALALREKHLPADHPSRSDTEVWLGALLLETGRAEEALGHLRRGTEIREAQLAEGNWRIAEARSWLGSGLIALGRAEEGLPLVVDAYPVIREQRGDHWHRTPAALERVIAAYRAVGNDVEAEKYSRLREERHRD